jgi:simple sugar transport system ATP-binding protein
MAERGSMRRETRLELIGISKSYPLVVANSGVDLRVAPGEIHAIVGENGAGKSTLMKIIYGLVRPDEGDILWNGHQVDIRNPGEAQRLGIGMVFQHFALFDTLTVAENIALAMPSAPSIELLSRQISDLATRYGLPVDPARYIYTMSMGERQRVEIIRALLQKPGLLIMDEPTSVLTPQAVETLFVTLRQLASEGCSILYISHKLEEVRALCSRATILRGGKVVGACDPRQETVASMARMMIGAELQSFSSVERSMPGAVLLAVEKLTAPTIDPFGTTLEAISLELRAGEILGIAGVSGNGQQELLQLLSGETLCPARNAIRLDGVDIGRMGPRARRGKGLASVPEDRLGRGAVPSLSLADNALLTATAADVTVGGLIRFEKVRDFARRIIEDFGVRGGGTGEAAGSLSGGNLQKFIVGREVLNKPRVLIIAQPTWGVDVGAALVIRQALLDLRNRGVAILVISEELDELLEVADRIAVIADGRLGPARLRAEITRDEIGLAMAGRALLNHDAMEGADVASA